MQLNRCLSEYHRSVLKENLLQKSKTEWLSISEKSFFIAGSLFSFDASWIKTQVQRSKFSSEQVFEIFNLIASTGYWSDTEIKYKTDTLKFFLECS